MKPETAAYTRVTVKVGSNVLTRSDGTPDVTRMSAIVDQIAALRRSGIEVILVSSGAVAGGRSELRGKADRRLDSVARRQLFSAVGQVRLINRYFELFRDYGMTVGQILTTKESFSTRGHYLNQRNCIEVMLANGVLPIVNENDTISVTELMFTDNDELAGLIAAMTGSDALVILSNVDGIFTGPPGEPGSELMAHVSPSADLSANISGSHSSFGRGGMLTKSRIAGKVADEGIEVIIARGTRPDVLTDLLVKRDPALPCTRFIPNPGPVSGVKKWLAHSDSFAKGRITLNAAAVEAVTGPRAASILPVGVTDVSGEFEKDDIVDILAPDGTVVGVGRISADADTARAMMGAHGQRPLVHYDYLTLF